MPITYSLIASNTLTTSAASVTFSAIPNTFTDLVVRVSVRRDAANRQDLQLAVNGNTTNNSTTWIQGNGATATSGTTQADTIRVNNIVPSTTETANTFGSAEFYIPNYLASTNKPISVFGAGEDNSTTAFIRGVAGLYSQTTAISSLVFSLVTGSFATGSSFFLYGIKNS